MKLLKNTDMTVSSVCLGTDWMGSGRPDADAFAVLDAFFDAGGCFLDTADVYGRWCPDGENRSEQTIGRWLKSRRGGFNGMTPVIATKGAHYDLRTRRCRVTREDITADVEAGLRALGTDVLDLFYLHRDDPSRPIGEILEWLNDLARAGKVRAFAASNYTAARLAEADAYAQAHGLQTFAAVSNQHSLAVPNRGHNNNPDPTLVITGPDELAYHRASGRTMIPFQATARGYFAKRAAGLAVDPGLAAAFDNERNGETLAALIRRSAETGLSVQTLTVTELCASADGYDLIPVVGVNTPARMRDIRAAMDIIEKI